MKLFNFSLLLMFISNVFSFETDHICNSSITLQMENLDDGGACVRGDYFYCFSC